MSFKLEKLKNIRLGQGLMDIYDHLEQAGIIAWPGQAASLSYYSIMGVVPFLALGFAIAKSFGLEDALMTALNDYFATFNGQDEVLDHLKTLAENMISNYSGSVMAFVALGIIFWSGYRILTLLENVFGHIYGYHPPRRTIHRIMDYFTIMVIVPMVLLAGGAVNIYLTGLTKATWSIPLGINPSGFFSGLIIVSPYLMWWLVLSWAYAYFSRGLVRWRERLLGGFIAGLVFQLFQTVYISTMFALTSYSPIYGGFALIPLFLIWLYAEWMIILAGGELTRRLADQFVIGRGLWGLVSPATWRGTAELCQLVVAEIIKNYQAEPVGGATSFRSLSRGTRAPMPALGGVISRLLAVNLLVRISGPTADDEGPSFLPARCPEQLTEAYIQEALESGTLEVIN
ncbi:MAG: YihY/virulence factor BrkB family protein [Candidatus Adiutrix sp.]|jgi:membrane protein|nr:YihY/virulence factor BrkB family protein [Candidatus Adiutrix sp.]